ncbi:hypothetical protein X801_07162, partial [Opisthorchis viverrini]
CSVGDRFLLVSEDPNTDWVFATSLKTRHSGYLPKCCVEKEYPELIERLEFFHPDTTSAQLKDLLKKAGAYSYLLRPCASRVGLYTLLLYDGARVRKYRLELVVQSEECTPHHLQPNGQRPDSAGDGVHRRSSEPAGRSVYTPDGETHTAIQMDDVALEVPRRRSDGIVAATGRDTSDPVNVPVANAPDVPTANDLYREPIAAGDLMALPRYRATTVVVYNGFTFPSVEAVVAAIEAHPGPWHPDVSSVTAHTNGDTPDIATRSCEADGEVGKHLAGDGTAPHVFKPVHREQKPQMNPPSSAIYMALRYTRQPAQLAVLEIHGEMSMTGAYSYLLRPCASRVGLYTLLLYDGARVRKYRLELVVQSEECTPHHLQPNGQRPDSAGDGVHRRSSEPAGRSVYTPDGETHTAIQMDDVALEVPRRRSDGIVAATGRDTSDPVNVPVANAPDVPTANDLYREPIAAGDLMALPRYRATTVVVYNGFTFPSVEAVVAAIEAHPGPWHPDVSSVTAHTNGDTPDIATRSCEADGEVGKHLAGDGTAPHVFKPVHREQKPQMNPPSSAIYMALRYTRQPAQLAVLEIHGEMSMMTTQRKKWKPYYAQLDRRQGILTLWGGEKRKTERFNLADCDFFPVHPLMY